MGRNTREVWKKRVDRWRGSGLTAAEFAAKAGVNAGTLTYWKWKLGSVEKARRQGPGQPPVRRSEFVEVIPTADVSPGPDATPSDALEVVLGGGLRILVPARFDADALRRVVAVLGGA
jgi:transposase